MTAITTGVINGVGLTCLVALAGAAGRAAGLITDRTVRELTRVAINLLLPCFLFEKVLGDFSWQRMDDYGVMMLASSALLALGMGLAWLMSFPAGLHGRGRRTAMAMSAFNNSINIPAPLAMALLPPDQADAVIVMFTLYNLVWSPLCWSLGVWLIADHGPDARGGLWRAILTPPAVAVMLGVICKIGPVESVALHPSLSLVHQAVTWTGDAAIPVCLVILGAIVAGVATRLRFSRRILATVALVKLALMPALTLLALRMVPGLDPLVVLAIAIQAASPPATNLVIIAEHFGGDVDTVGTVIFFTYLLSLGTFVLWLGLAL